MQQKIVRAFQKLQVYAKAAGERAEATRAYRRSHTRMNGVYEEEFSSESPEDEDDDDECTLEDAAKAYLSIHYRKCHGVAFVLPHVERVTPRKS